MRMRPCTARGGEAGGGADLGVGGWGVVGGAWRKGRDHAAGGGGETEGAWLAIQGRGPVAG